MRSRRVEKEFRRRAREFLEHTLAVLHATPSEIAQWEAERKARRLTEQKTERA